MASYGGKRMTDSGSISLAVGYKDTKVTFHLGMISMKEEAQYTQRFTDIADKDDNKSDKEYQIILDSLAAWAVNPATQLTKDGKQVPLGKGTPAEAIHEFFKDKTHEKERILHATMVYFRNEMSPEVSFL